jgi:hypothetical protein
MRTLRALLSALSLMLLVPLLCEQTFAQSNPVPAELSQSSSLSEILSWLDQNGLAEARIGLHSRWDSAVVSQGFRLFKVDGCVLTLKNDNIKILSTSANAEPWESDPFEFFQKRADMRQRYPAYLQIRLVRISDNRSKAPHLYTKKPEDARVFGSWRTEFYEKRGRSRPQDVLLMSIPIPVLPEDKPDTPFHPNQLYGNSVTFTFDRRETSEQFYVVFQRAITLCAKK